MDRDDLGFVSVQDIVVVAEQAAQCGCGWPGETEGLDASEQPAAELFGIKRGGGAVELDVGLAVWCEEEGGFIAGEDQVIEG